jgi:hypothetical protein
LNSFKDLPSFFRSFFTISHAGWGKVDRKCPYPGASVSYDRPVMWQHLKATAQRTAGSAWAVVGPWSRRAAVSAVAFARGPLKSAVIAIAQTIAALLLLFYEWGWRPLAQALARLSKYVIFARFEAWLQSLPPYGALAMFAAPAVCLFPLKLIALYLFATGHPLAGIALIAGAKIAGTAVVARIFILTQPQLMPWKERMFASIRASAAWRTGRAVRVAVKRWANRTWIGLKPQRVWLAQRAAAPLAHLQAWLASLGRTLR